MMDAFQGSAKNDLNHLHVCAKSVETDTQHRIRGKNESTNPGFTRNTVNIGMRFLHVAVCILTYNLGVEQGLLGAEACTSSKHQNADHWKPEEEWCRWRYVKEHVLEKWTNQPTCMRKKLEMHGRSHRWSQNRT